LFFYNLFTGIHGLQNERDNLLSEVLQDRQQLSQLQKQLDELKTEYDYRNNSLKEKDLVLREYDRMIDESEKAYNKVNSLMCIISKFLFKVD